MDLHIKYHEASNTPKRLSKNDLRSIASKARPAEVQVQEVFGVEGVGKGKKNILKKSKPCIKKGQLTNLKELNKYFMNDK